MNLKVFSSFSRLIPSARLAGMLLAAGCLSLWWGFPGGAMAREVNWNSLNLSPQQEDQINRLERQWESTHHEVNARIERDMGELKTALPSGDRQRIRQIQNRIMSQKMYLMNQSMDTFLKKQETLTPTQRHQLQKMLPVSQ